MHKSSLISLASMILTAPGWVRVGITAPSERLRQEAALELAIAIVEELEHPAPVHDRRQIALPL